MKKILIVEGVSSSRAELRDYVAFSVYVDVALEGCYQGRLQREDQDPYYVGWSDEQKVALWSTWVSEEDGYLERDNPAAHADIVINGRDSFEKQYKKLKRAIKQKALHPPAKQECTSISHR